MKRRPIDLLVLSDIHLGTYGCHAEELCAYLDSIEPRCVVLNGDIIDIWNFKKSYWPQAHHEVIERLLAYPAHGVDVYYLPGNHDDLLRRFSDIRLGSFRIQDKLVLEVGGKSVWFFHGDVFDVSIQYARWIAKLGGIGYDLLIVLNRVCNGLLRLAGQPPYSFSKKIKASVKKAVSFMGDFEKTAALLAAENRYDYVVLGHIHNPAMKTVETSAGSVGYMNSGDWVENLTSLEYANGRWTLFRYQKAELAAVTGRELQGAARPVLLSA